MAAGFEHGIIEVPVLDAPGAAARFGSLQGASWRQARVAQRYDGLRIKEIVDQEQRDALAANPDFVVAQAHELLATAYPLAKDAVKKWWDVEVARWSSPQFTLYKVGHFIKSHRDCGNAFPERLFTVVVYLTSDYSGGEIVFPRIGKSFHPAAGAALIFPSDYVHEVAAVRSGEKCVFLFFLDSR